ncbi:hypothetical protein [Streptomyces sp. NPDC058671]|uniref:hypothetical protein n=1 Tax=Streptomyces sp. NPDC058671 TaxID=3346590 RepID=UPI0036492627
MIERLEFQRGDVWFARHFKGWVTFLVGHSKAGKSTAIEALLYPLGLLTALESTRAAESAALVEV